MSISTFEVNNVIFLKFISTLVKTNVIMQLKLKGKDISLIGKDLVVDLHREIPVNLYKYFSISSYSIDNLIENKIHFSHPFKLNDIMEGSSQLWDLNDFIGQYVSETSRPYLDVLTLVTQHFPEEVYQHRGVLCLTEDFNNNLFWPHYTSELGFCIEFNSNDFLKSLEHEKIICFPMDYEILQTINFNDYIFREELSGKVEVNAQLPLTYALAVKDKIWAYEKEWRIILTKKDLGKISHPLHIINQEQYLAELKGLVNRNIPYDRQCINRIILSTLFFSNSRFANKIKVNNNTTEYYFREGNKDLFQFLLELQQNYNDKVFQIDRDIIEGEIVSKINYRIKIIYLSEKYVSIESEKLF